MNTPMALNKLPFPDAYRRLKELETATDQTEPSQTTLPIHQITVLPQVFQVRRGIDPDHIDRLVRELRTQDELDPITVWQCGEHTILIDGHHRLQTYETAGRLNIPVHFMPGTLEDAMRVAEDANMVTRLEVTKDEKADYAWKLVNHPEAVGQLSKAEIVKRAKVGKGTVDNMRKAKTVLGCRAKLISTWYEANKAWKAADGEDPDSLASWKDAEKERLARQISEGTGGRIKKWPDITADALARVLGRKTVAVAALMIEAWGYQVQVLDSDGNEVEDIDNCPDLSDWSDDAINPVEVPF